MKEIQVLKPNVIPVRKHVSSESLSIIGIPVRFHRTTLDDFNTFNIDSMISIKGFVHDYLSLIGTKARHSPQDGIFFYGSNGVGKTMLSSIILKQAYRYRYSCQRVTFIKYVDSYTSSWNKEVETTTFWEHCKSVDYLVLEEVGKEIDSKITKPILEDLLRYREEKGLTTIMCTNLPVKDLEELYGASIMSLIRGNMIPVKLTGKDRRYVTD